MDVKMIWPIKQSSAGIYTGYSEPVYDGKNRYSIYLEMSDGCRLAVDYYIPTKGGVEAEEKLPAVLNFTPYGRVTYGRDMPPAMFGVKCPEGLDPDGLYFNDIGMEGVLDLTKYGYILCFADVRGCGASFGARITTNSRREATDGKEIVEWLASQPFCSGRVGTMGYSYTGQTQLEIISCQPKGIKCAFVCMTDYDKYDGWMRNGIQRAFRTEPDVDFGSTPEQIEKTIDRICAMTVPVDEDPDKVLLRQAIAEHVNSGKQIPIMRDLKWRDSYWEPSGGEHWNIIGMSPYKDKINNAGAAIYVVGGTYDVFRRDSYITYANLTCPKKLLIGPWYHMDTKQDTRWDLEMRRWFDYWLKDIDNGIMDEEPINIRMANFNFRNGEHFGADTGYYLSEKDWPLHSGKRTELYLSSEKSDIGPFNDGSLCTSPKEGSQKILHEADYGMNAELQSVYSTDPNGLDERGLCFTSKAFASDTRIIGHPTAYINFSLEDAGWMTKDLDLDIFVNLSDYDPVTGKAFLFSYGQLRSSLRGTAECPYDFMGLPWHPCRKGDNEYLELHKDYELEIDIMPTTYVIKKGHSLRVSITNTMQASYFVGWDAYAEDPQCKRPVMALNIGGEKGSRIVLPDIYAEDQ